MTDFTTADIRKALRTNGPMTREELIALFGVKGKKGSTAKLVSYVNGNVRHGWVSRGPDGRYEFVSEPQSRASYSRTVELDERARAFLGKGPADVYDLSDELDVTLPTVRACMERIGARKERRGSRVLFYLSEEGCE